MMKEHEVNNLNNFIMGWYSEDTAFCDRLIEMHKNSPGKRPGIFGKSTHDRKVKDSYDMYFQKGEVPDFYLDHVHSCLKLYHEKYPHAVLDDGVDINEQTQVQYYPPGGGYKVWHMERAGLAWPIVTRQLVFMTYLNTVNDAGGTEFYYQDIKTKAEKGLTLIWPSDWPWTHRGEVSPTESKYIITGWFNINIREENDKSV
jgi:hypothetical protein